MKLAFSLIDMSLCVFKGVLFWFNLTTKVAGAHALSSQGKFPAPGPRPLVTTLVVCFVLARTVQRDPPKLL